MAKIAKELTAMAVSRLKEDGAYAVGGVPGLQLQILGASRVWVLRFVLHGKRRRMGLGKREHRIPLPRQAVELLRKQPRIIGTNLVFPSSRNTPLSDMTLTAVMRRLKRTEVPHGWRSTFRDWVGDCTDYPSELAEIALAHSVGSKVEQA